MRLLALDLATHLGFCFGSEAGVVQHGSYKLPSTGDDLGTFLLAYEDWLTRGIALWGPDEIVFEMPILPATTNLSTLRKLYALCGVTEMRGRSSSLGRKRVVREANLLDIRKHFIGVTRAPKTILKNQRRTWLKEQTVTECRRRGFRPDDDNAADALALFSFVLTVRNPGFVMQGNEIARAAA